MAQLTITFRGLCLFARSTDKTQIRVFLAQPAGMPHSTIRRYKEVNGSWTAEEVPRWCTLEYGTPGSTATIPGDAEMSNFSKIKGSRDLPKKDAKAAQTTPPKWTPHDSRGSHVILNGGSLSVRDETGVWELTDDPAAGEFLFPYILEWRGEGPETSEQQIWNVMEAEAPRLGPNSEEKKSILTEEQANDMAAMHFAAYFQILIKGNGPKLKFKRKELLTTDAVPESEDKGKKSKQSLIVSSCPSGVATLT